MLLVLPSVCLILGVLLWGVSSTEIKGQKAAFEITALIETGTHAQVFAQQLSKAFAQADNVTLTIKQEWEQSKGKMQLETMFRHGLNLSFRHLSVSIINRDGTPISHSQDSPLRANVADRDYFTYHQRVQSDEFRVSQPIAGRTTGTTLILFTRRLNAADGTFDGLVVVAVKPTYFGAFYDNT
ncbi:MAG TPA: hypothetical protein VGP12_04445, partial [Nitrosospira sp.]|nr:hypothetical protein [Nitrosospira sp.]